MISVMCTPNNMEQKAPSSMQACSGDEFLAFIRLSRIHPKPLVLSTHSFASSNTSQTTWTVGHFARYGLLSSLMNATILQRDFGVQAQGQSCPARLLLTSFRRQRHFTHYTYRILLWVPTPLSTERIECLKQTAVSSSQEVYENEFRPVVRHDFVFRIEEYD
jgi:hypothetical protein